MAKSVEKIRLEEFKEDAPNVREVYDEEALGELAASMSERGLIQPVIARKGKYEEDGKTIKAKHVLIAGHRRFRAAKMLGWEVIETIFVKGNETEFLANQIVENLQRENLSPIEEAEAFRKLLNATGKKPKEVAVMIGKSYSYVATRLKLLEMAEPVKQKIHDGKVSVEKALKISQVKDEGAQKELAEAASEKKMSAKQTAAAVEEVKNGEEPEKAVKTAKAAPLLIIRTPKQIKAKIEDLRKKAKDKETKDKPHLLAVLNGQLIALEWLFESYDF